MTEATRTHITLNLLPPGIQILALGQDLLVRERPLATQPIVMFFADKQDTDRLLGKRNFLFRDLRLEDEAACAAEIRLELDILKTRWHDAGLSRAGLAGQEILDVLSPELQDQVRTGDLVLLWFNDDGLRLVGSDDFYEWGTDTSE